MKTKMRGNSGVTLVTLGIVVVVLMIMAGMTIYNVSAAVNSARLNAFTTELRIMQAQVNSLNEKMRNDEEITVDGNNYKGEEIAQIGQEINGNLQEKANEAFDAVSVNQEDRQNYRYYDANLIKNGLAVEGVGQELLIDIKDREVISYNGLMNDGYKYYNLESLPDGIYNVQHEQNNETPQFEVASKQISSKGEWEFEISNVQYQGYIDKWKVKYKEENADNWYESDDLKFTVNKSGVYIIKIGNNDVESEEVQCKAEYSVKPELLEGMQAIKFDEDGNEQNIENPEKDDWYSYEITEDEDMSDGGTTNGGNSRWANAKMNENYYVWIPRYAYKVIEDEEYTDKEGNTSNKVEAQFIETKITSDNVEDELGTGYEIPSAFTIDEKEVSGIWVGKYFTSGTTEVPRIVPDAESLKNLDDDQMSAAAKALDTEKIIVYVVGDEQQDAINYLTRSQYGRNGTAIPVEEEIVIPNEFELDEENGGIAEISLEGEDEQNEEIPDELKTSTGNRYGVYDMTGEGFRMYLRNK